MASFTQYSSADASGPGQITGAVGTLLTILDACLVNGYSGKTAAGWSKPLANSGNMGCYKQGTGTGSPTQYTLVINDDAITSGTPNEASATGYVSVSALSGGSGTGVGTGSFPATGQMSFSTNCVIIRKSATTATNLRSWTIFADARTFYLFIQTGDTSTNYYDFAFGDFYSLAGSSDPYRCMIIGRNAANSGTNGTANGGLDRQSTPYMTSGQLGTFMANNLAGTSASPISYTFGDVGKGTVSTLTSNVSTLAGIMPTPNPFDNSYYMSPVLITDISWGIRGQLRGIYHLSHPTSAFTNGMTFSGAGDFAGKSFVIVSPGMNGGMYCIETSNTVNTN